MAGVATTASAVNSLATKAAKTADVSKTTTATKDVKTSVDKTTSAVREVKAAVQEGKPIRVTMNPQTITLTLDGRTLASVVTKIQTATTRAHGGQALAAHGRPSAIGS